MTMTSMNLRRNSQDGRARFVLHGPQFGARERAGQIQKLQTKMNRLAERREEILP
jgi:hypothetical protein